MKKNDIELVKINNKEDALKFVNEFEDYCNLKITLFENGQFTNKQLEILEVLKENKDIVIDNAKEITLCIPYEKIPKDVFEKITDFCNTFPKIQTNATVFHMYKNSRVEYSGIKKWDIKAILKANNAIDKICDKIKASNLTPVEALAYIHKYVSTVSNYKSGSEKIWNSDDQYFVGAFTRKKEFVCAGFSSLEKEIIDTLNMPGLKCDIVHVVVYNFNRGTEEPHARCMIKIDDPIYNIKRTAFDDPTWDNDTKITTPKYAHFMMTADVHENDSSTKYDYFNLSKIFSENKNMRRSITIPNVFRANDKQSCVPLDQKLIETIHFNMMNKTTKKSCSEIYNELAEMAKVSREEQLNREYSGPLCSYSLHLTKEEAKNLYKKNTKPNSIELDK